MGVLGGPEKLITVPRFFQANADTLVPLSAPAPVIPSPKDDGIRPESEDDTSAPNAVTVARMNRIVCVSSANVGYSKAAKDTQVLPCALEYDATVAEGTKPDEFTLTLRMTLEYESAFPEEGMVVWMKKHQQVINDEKVSDLLLIETAFEDYVSGQWVPISADIRYADEADAIVQAVVTTDSGQTAGRMKTVGAVEDAMLGPVGERGRIVLTYYCAQLYSYTEMAMGASTGSRSLVPLCLQLPWAALDNPGSHCRLHARVQAPLGSYQLDPQANILAYQDLQQNLSGEERAVLPKQNKAADGTLPSWDFISASLPPTPTMCLAWLSVPKEDDGWEQVDTLASASTCATLLKPDQVDDQLLRTSLPGAQRGHLLRCRVEAAPPSRHPDSIRVHTDITISDASGSTGMMVKGSGGAGETVRQRFNQHEERRILKRLEAIPKLREAGVLMERDIWRQQFVIFDHGVKHEFEIETVVGSLDAITVNHLVEAVTKSTQAATTALTELGKKTLLEMWQQAMSTLRGVRAGGTTSFIAGADRAKDSYTKVMGMKFRGRPEVGCTTYVNFDTDGGNNCGPCYDAISQLVEDADVVQGHVLGVGSWVDQDCATKVAKRLKGTASLALTFPENAQADDLFRQDLSRWIKVLRTTPVSLTVSAGAVTWEARQGSRSENGIDCLFAVGDNVRFDVPDVSEADFTKAVVTGIQAGESTMLYLITRWPLEELAGKLEVVVGGSPATVSIGCEQMRGLALGHHWLSMLGGATPPQTAVNGSSLCSRLRHRLEDDLSFSWNLPTKSGSTAALGRAKTEKRMPVPKRNQPDEPTAPSLDVPQRMELESGRRVFAKKSLQATLSGGWGGATSLCAGAAPPPAMAQSAAAPEMMNSNQFCAPSASAQSLSVYSPPAGRCRRASPGKGKGGFRGGHDDNYVSANMSPGPSTPSVLLGSSGHMQWGFRESPREATSRSLKALKYIANCAGGPAKGSAVVSEPEDPLVEGILGQEPAAVGGRLPHAVHAGFVCDSCNATPIVGVRFKATNASDVDITESCRRNGSLAGAAGFRPISDLSTAMRWSLAAVVGWRQFLWKSGPPEIGASPDLASLKTADLIEMIWKLPDTTDAV